MITVYISVKLILRSLSYTVAILGGALILAIIVMAATSNQDLGDSAFWCSVFLGILAVFTGELKKRETLVSQLLQEHSAVPSLASAPVQALSAPEDHPIHMNTIIDFTCGAFDVHITRWTDRRRTLHASSRTIQSDVPQRAGDMRGARQR